MKTLTKEQAQALYAFLECFDLYDDGSWPAIEEAMRNYFGVEQPERTLDEAREALR